MTSQIKKIQPGDKLTFPCWLWDSQDLGRLCPPHWVHYNEKFWRLDPPKTSSLLSSHFTHWHPEQTEEPTLIPAIEELRSQQKGVEGGSETPKTDSFFCNPPETESAYEFARGLERENQALAQQIKEAEGRITSWESRAILAEEQLANEQLTLGNLSELLDAHDIPTNGPECAGKRQTLDINQRVRRALAFVASEERLARVVKFCVEMDLLPMAFADEDGTEIRDMADQALSARPIK